MSGQTQCHLASNGTLFSQKGSETLAHITTWMSLEDIMCSEIRRSQKDPNV